MVGFLRKMLTTVIDDALMPTGKNLVPALFFAVLITVLNIICRLFGWWAGFRLGGCFGAILVLLMLLVIERSEYSAVSKLYRNVELRAKDIKARQQAISADWKNGRASRVHKERGGSVQGRANHGPKDEDDSDGFDGGDIVGEESDEWDVDLDGYDEDDAD